VSNDPVKYAKDLQGVVDGVVANFPQAAPRVATGS
jgi:hypothetical protein